MFRRNVANTCFIYYLMVASFTLNILAQNIATPTNPESSRSRPRTPDKLTSHYLATSRGFRVESHRILTIDGYFITAERLINPMADPTKLSGLIVVQHGILCASPLFLLNSSPNLDKPANPAANHNRRETSNSLAIALANRGYDVWLTNFRGTQDSRDHLNLQTLGQKYWNFNVDTLIEQDLQASVDYILKYTNQSVYAYVGHSLGATVGLGSLLVHKNTHIIQKLSCSVLMAPVASTRYMKSSLIPTFRLATMLYGDLSPFPGEFSTFSSFTRYMCPFVPRLCSWMAAMFVGVEQGDRLNLRLPNESLEFTNDVNAFILMMHQSISIQMLKHIVQVHSSGRLSRFNYGTEINRAKYNESRPPIYDLTQINQPQLKLAIVSGSSDAISTPHEVRWIADQIGDKVGHFERIVVPLDPFNHMDLIMSKDAGKFVNRQLIEFIEKNKCFQK